MPAARSVSKKQVFFTSLLSKSLLLRQHLETLLFSRVFYYIFLIFIFFEHTQIKKQRAKASHQADNLTKLWQKFLSVLELIVQILCAVEVQKPSVALGNAHL